MPHNNDDLITRSATLTPNSYDPATRNFEATVATEAVVRGIALDLASAVIPDRLPLVVDHSVRARDTVGFMREPRRENGSVIMRGSLSGDSSLDWLHARMSDGTFDSVSIAFTVPKNGWRTGAEGVRTAVGAQFRHVAIVTQAADEGARIRSADDDEDSNDDNGDNRGAINRRIRSLGRDLGLSRDTVDRAIDDGL